jgi:ketosteroid isomerase-like protein
MNRREKAEFFERFLAAWNSQDVERVAGCYTADVIFRDPNTRGNVVGGDAMRRYLKKLFASWKMSWALREAFPFSEDNGGAFLWRASIARPDGGKAVELDGMDLVLIEDGLIKRNDVYFDRSALASLLQ